MNDTSIHTTDTLVNGSWMDSIPTDGSITIDTVQVADSLQNALGALDQVPTDEEQWMMAMSLMLKVVLILVVGFVIWRVIIAYNKKNAKPKGGQYFKRNYSDKWKNR